MTVITYGSSSLDNAKTRRHARRRAAAMELERFGGILEAAFGLEPEDKVEAVSKPVNRVGKALTLPRQVTQYRPSADNICLPKVALYNAGFRKVRKEAIHIIKGGKYGTQLHNFGR